jgi:predicted amidohydrolase YtcJ
MHGAVLNSLALKKYGISASTPTPAGGVIVRKPGSQEPWGLIMETAFLPVVEQSEAITAQQEVDWSRAGQLLYAQTGITTAQEGASHLPQIATIKRASDAGANLIDVVAYPFITDLDKVQALIPVSQWGRYNNRFKIGGVKITIDGSPQGRTAFFTTPYLTGGPAGEKNWRGEPTFPQDLVDKAVSKVYGLGVRPQGRRLAALECDHNPHPVPAQGPDPQLCEVRHSSVLLHPAHLLLRRCPHCQPRPPAGQLHQPDARCH